ncbi:hypothetical protein FO507_16405 [Bacillus mojavensis]|nr:hypothetical protein [Bacillus mojavensis]
MARLAFIFGEILLRNESLSSLYADFANIYIGTGSGFLYFIVIRSSFPTIKHEKTQWTKRRF